MAGNKISLNEIFLGNYKLIKLLSFNGLEKRVIIVCWSFATSVLLPFLETQKQPGLGELLGDELVENFSSLYSLFLWCFFSELKKQKAFFEWIISLRIKRIWFVVCLLVSNFVLIRATFYLMIKVFRNYTPVER